MIAKHDAWCIRGQILLLRSMGRCCRRGGAPVDVRDQVHVVKAAHAGLQPLVALKHREHLQADNSAFPASSTGSECQPVCAGSSDQSAHAGAASTYSPCHRNFQDCKRTGNFMEDKLEAGRARQPEAEQAERPSRSAACTFSRSSQLKLGARLRPISTYSCRLRWPLGLSTASTLPLI